MLSQHSCCACPHATWRPPSHTHAFLPPDPPPCIPCPPPPHPTPPTLTRLPPPHPPPPQVFFAIFLAAMGAAQAQLFFPDVAKGKAATQRVFHIIDRQPLIDATSQVGG